jgi:hypothetical protein
MWFVKGARVICVKAWPTNKYWAVFWIALFWAQHAASQPLPAVSRILLSQPLAGAQPAVTLEKGYGFVVTAQQSDGNRSSLHWVTIDFEGRRTSSGVISEGTDRFVNWADTPGITVLDNGDWVAFWLERNDPEAPEGYDIKVVRSTDRGRTWSQPISPHHDGTKTQHGFVSLVPDGGDRVLIAWLDGRLAAVSTGSHDSHDHESARMTLRSAVLTRANKVLGEALIDERTCSCCQTDLARVGDSTLLAYRDRSADEIRDISLSRRRAGNWGPAEPVHRDDWRIEGCPVNGPSLAVNGKRAIVFWPTLIDDSMVLRYKLIDDFATPIDQVAAYTLALPKPPSGRVDAVQWKNGFLVTWVSRAKDHPSVDIATIDVQGTATVAPPMAEPQPRGRATGFPRIAGDGTRALVVWPELDNGAPVIGMSLLR